MALSAAFGFYVSELSFAEMRLQAGDLGIFMQAFGTNGNGRLYWTTLVYLHFGTSSLLNVHFSWAVFAITPLYSAFPSENTLFLVQAVVIAAAAFPLAGLARRLTGSSAAALSAGLLYLVWSPMVAGMPNSFHLESFLPLEFFALAYCWVARRYWSSLALTVLAGFTLDAAPILTFLLGVWFLTYPAQAALRLAIHRHPTADTGARSFLRRLVRTSRAALASSEVRAGLAILGASVAVFFAMRYLEIYFPGWLGIRGSSLGATRIVGFALANFPVDFSQKVTFWLVMLATVAFLPLLRPRSLILLVPWVGYTFLEGTSAWYSLPSHYVAIAAVPLFLGLAFAFQRFPWGGNAPAHPFRYRRQRAPGMGVEAATRRAPSAWKLNRGGSGLSLVRTAVVLGIVVANLALMPLNPLTAGVWMSSGNSIFRGSGNPYALNTTPGPEASQIEGLAGLIPSDASVLTIRTFLPFVASDPNAWGYNPEFLAPLVPFNDTNLPEYILSTESGLGRLNDYIPNVTRIAWNQSDYGVRGWVPTTQLGSVFLFEEGYRNSVPGSAATFGRAPVIRTFFNAGSTLSPHPPQSNLTNATFGSAIVPVIQSPVATGGEIFYGIGTGHSLGPGAYTVNVTMNITGPACSTVSNGTILRLFYGIPGVGTLGSLNLSIAPNGSRLACGSWVVDSPFPALELDLPLPGIFLRGNLLPLASGLAFTVLQVAVSPATS